MRFSPSKKLSRPSSLGVRLLNDDRLGRVLDRLYQTSITSVFLAICLEAVKRFDIRCERAHLDATSMSVSGAYMQSSDAVPLAATLPIQVCYGYSRDHRPDLKQFVMNLVCWGDGDIPAFLELADGNQSDKARFAGLLGEFQQQWEFEGIHVADAALYSVDNIQQLGSLRWISRVPLTIVQTNALIEDIDLDRLSRQPFACEADAQQALERFEKTLKIISSLTQVSSNSRTMTAPDDRPNMPHPPL